jgi:integrase
MSDSAKQKPKVGALVPTKAEGIYYRLKKNGTKTFYARRPDGTRNFEKCDSFEAAKARRAEFIGKNHKGEVIGNPSTTLRQIIEQWRATRTDVKPRTREGEELHIRVHFGSLLRRRVRDINRAVILGWLAGLKRQDGKPGPLSESTKAHVFATLTIVLDHAVDADIISINPCRSITGKKKPRQGRGGYRVLTADELDRLVKGVGQQLWMAFLIRFAALTGLRLGELIELRWDDISFEQNAITVARSRGKDGNVGTPKGGVEATIPMLPEVAPPVNYGRA